MKATPFLDYYNARTNPLPNSPYPCMPANGLCSAFCVPPDLYSKFKATEECKPFQLFIDTAPTDGVMPLVFWGADCQKIYADATEEERIKMLWEFGPLRQTIVLLCAAMNGELE